MGVKDLENKILIGCNDVFADIYNTLVFGRRYLKEERLDDGSTESVYRAEDGSHRNQYRDILKHYRDQANLQISSFGIENQSDTDRMMPVRVMNYDAASYLEQAKAGRKRIAPVLTIVLNMSERRWCKEKSLHDLIETDMELLPYIQDYKIVVYDIAYLEEEVIDRFQSDFKEVALFFRKKRLGGMALDSAKELRHAAEVLEFLTVYTKDKRYEQMIQEVNVRKEKGEVINMCWVADQLEKQGVEKGIEIGEARGIEIGEARGIDKELKKIIGIKYKKGKSVRQMAEEMEQSEEKIRRLMQEMELPELMK